MIVPIEHWRTLDSEGQLMPWYTRPCLEWLNTVDLVNKGVFEYGCGLSSLWYKLRGAQLRGVDSSFEWAFSTGQQHATDKSQYITSIRGLYDLIVIDGDFRDECTETALRHLLPGGYLIADNFEQASADLPDWPKTRELTKHLPLTLYKEPTHPDWQTAVWHNV